MRNVKWLLAAGLIAATTAGCMETTGYPNTAYNSGYNNGYANTGYYNNGYANNGYYAPSAYNSGAYSPGYVAPGYANSNPGYVRDANGRVYRDANRDGVPDRYQR